MLYLSGGIWAVAGLIMLAFDELKLSQMFGIVACLSIISALLEPRKNVDDTTNGAEK